MAEEVETPFESFENVHFTLMLPFEVCASPSDGGGILCLTTSPGNAGRMLLRLGASEDLYLGELSELSGHEPLDAMICLGRS